MLKEHLHFIFVLQIAREKNLTIAEASRNYQIPAEILREYEEISHRWSHLEAPEKCECTEQDLKALDLLALLHISGFSEQETRDYFVGDDDPGTQSHKQLGMLERKRTAVLKEIHQKEEQLNHLDYLRYELQKITDTHK